MYSRLNDSVKHNLCHSLFLFETWKYTHNATLNNSVILSNCVIYLFLDVRR